MPTVHEHVKDCTSKLGSDATFQCKLMSDYQMDVIWFVDTYWSNKSN